MSNMILVNVLKNNKGTLVYEDIGICANVFIGKNGLSFDKKEGDGKTPFGIFDLGIAMGRHPSDYFEKKLKVDYIEITENLYWVDDINSKYYNQLVDVSKCEEDWKTAEHLIDYPISYEFLIEIKTNPLKIPGKGSAIFLHVAENRPTLGCIATSRDVVKMIIENMDKNTRIAMF